MGQAASDGWVSFPASAGPLDEDQRRPGMARTGLGLIGGLMATVTAVALAAVLALVFAVALVVAAILSGVLVLVYALTHRRRPRSLLIEARRIGHSWVAYGWDQRPR
jgi:hypothetical protein